MPGLYRRDGQATRLLPLLTLTPGPRLGRYEILSAIGVGLATLKTKLPADVKVNDLALLVLPAYKF